MNVQIAPDGAYYYKVLVDGKTVNNHLSKTMAEHVSKLYTDPAYKNTYEAILHNPASWIPHINAKLAEHSPRQYVRLGRYMSYDLDPERLSWEHMKAVAGDSWKYELLDGLKRLRNKYIVELKDNEGQKLLYNMALALKHDDEATYNKLLRELDNRY